MMNCVALKPSIRLDIYDVVVKMIVCGCCGCGGCGCSGCEYVVVVWL